MLPKFVAGVVALFAVLFVVVLTKPPPEEDLARPDVSTLDPEIVAERAASRTKCLRKATPARRRFTRGRRRWARVRTEDVLSPLRAAAARPAPERSAIVYVLFLTTEVDEFGNGNWRTTNFGSAVHDPESFFKILLDALTFAGLLFIVASGFSLIFGLMRVVNMAHGSFYLLGGYIAYEVQQKMNPESQGFSTQPFQTSTWEWVLPLLVTVGCIALFGLGMQQLLLRWNQGQDLRQALITIAISVIVADQVIAHFPRTVRPEHRSSGATRSASPGPAGPTASSTSGSSASSTRCRGC